MPTRHRVGRSLWRPCRRAPTPRSAAAARRHRSPRDRSRRAAAPCPAPIASRQLMIARMVSGLSHSASSTVLRPGLDALGDLDLALAREQLDRAHLAQVHAHRIVGAAEILVERGGAVASSSSRSRSPLAAAPFASPPPTLTPISSNMAISSSTTSGEISSSGKAALISSWVTKPRSRAWTRTRLIAGDIADQFLKSALQALAGWRLRRRDDTCCSLFRHAVFPSQPADPSSGRRAHRPGPRPPIASRRPWSVSSVPFAPEVDQAVERQRLRARLVGPRSTSRLGRRLADRPSLAEAAMLRQRAPASHPTPRPGQHQPRSTTPSTAPWPPID